MNNNRHMDLETFAACVLQTLQQKLSYINIQLVHKAAENDATIPLLTFTSKNRHHTIYPSIPIELYYNEYISGTNLRDLLTRIVMEIAVGNDLYQHHLPDFDDYIVASDYITSRIVSAIKNTEFLQDRVYKLIPCTDLCYVYELDITQLMATPEHQRCNIQITNKMLNNWNASVNELQEIAERNNPIRHPAQILYSDEIDTSTSEEAYAILKNNIVVVSTTDQINGFIAVTYPGITEQIYSHFQSDFYILPATIHEAICYSKADMSIDRAKALVYTVNHSADMHPQCFLSDDVFCIKNGQLTSATQNCPLPSKFFIEP